MLVGRLFGPCTWSWCERATTRHSSRKHFGRSFARRGGLRMTESMTWAMCQSPQQPQHAASLPNAPARFRPTTLSIHSPGTSCVERQEDNEEHQQRNVIEVVADVAPGWSAVSGGEPGGEGEGEHVHRTPKGTEPYPPAAYEGKAN